MVEEISLLVDLRNFLFFFFFLVFHFQLVPHSVNQSYAPATTVKPKEKVVARSSNRFPSGGKENMTGKAAPSQNSSTKSSVQVEKVATKVREKSLRTTVVPKVSIHTVIFLIYLCFLM